MPELPEVESLVRRLRPHLIGRKVVSANVGWTRILATPRLAEFQKQIVNQRFVSAGRRGKYLMFQLSSKQLLIHLRMSGNLEVRGAHEKRSKHEHVVFKLDNDQELRFHDTRKFGRVYLVDKIEMIVGKLGPEPLAVDFYFEEFFARIKNKKGAIKSLLLKQEFLAGVGNIYADESLWRAKIHPLRPASSLDRKEAALLYKAIRRILTEAIEAQGTDNGDNVVPEGDYLPRVYGREGQKCQRCRSKILKMTVGQRGTHYCPACQLPS